MNTLTRITAIAAAALCLTASAQAADDQYLFGNWNGARTQIENQGVKFNLGYASNVAHNTQGGSEDLTRYADQWVVGADLDMAKLAGWNKTKVNVTLTNRNGKNLSTDAHLGTFQQVQEVHGRGQTWRLTNLSIEKSFLNDSLTLKAGRLGIGADFAAFSCDFQNLTFCGSQPGNLVGSYWNNWPVSVWAGVASLKTTADSYVKAGVYQVNPAYVDDAYAVRRGLRPNNPHGTTGALIPVEFGYLPKVQGLPGSYKAGLWYNTSDSADLMHDQQRQALGTSSLAAQQHTGAYGLYINFAQQVTGTAGGKGATVFLNATQADKFTAATDRQVALGMEYKGVFNRPADMIGVALGATHGNGRYANFQRAYNSVNPAAPVVVNAGYEYAAEVFYSFSPVPSVTLRPNLQFVKHPGGTAQNADAVVFGLKTSIAF